MARELAPHFKSVTGIDPSKGMVEQASSLTPQDRFPNIDYAVAPAEDLPFLTDQSVDVVVAGQSSHWFDIDTFWPEMARVVRPGGVVALFGYKDHTFIHHPRATGLGTKYTYGKDPERALGPYWQQPGRNRVQDQLRAHKPPERKWEGVQRIEYEPDALGVGKGEGTMFLTKSMTIANVAKYMRTWSSVHAWQEAHPDKKAREEGGEGDIADYLFDEIKASEDEWQNDDRWLEREVTIEWGSALVLAKRRVG